MTSPDPNLAELARYDFRGRSEQDVREEWIAPLLRLLGYGPSTLHQVRRGETLRLRAPMRMLGSTRYALDYRPTVHGRGLWIIEAKAPEGIDRELHLAQAWTYATHPEVNVPLFVLADGRHLAIHDASSQSWDVPILDIESSELPKSFEALRAALSPQSVARAARDRLIGHLEKVMESELDYAALDATVSSVREAAIRARISVAANRATVSENAERARQRIDEEVLASARLWRLAQERNIPFGWSLNDVGRAMTALALTPFAVPAEVEQMFAAVRGKAGEDRAFWGLRTYRVAVVRQALRDFEALEQPGWVMPTIRAHLLGFPDDAAAASAHRLELILFALVMRGICAPGPSARSRVEDFLGNLGVEAKLALGTFVHSHSVVLNTALLYCRLVWSSIDWDELSVSELADRFLEELRRTEYDTAFARQFVGVTIGEDWADHDPLIDYTILALADWPRSIELSPEEVSVIRSRVGAPGSTAAAVQGLLARHAR